MGHCGRAAHLAGLIPWIEQTPPSDFPNMANKHGLTWFTYAAPSRFYGMAGKAVPWLWALCIALAAVGLFIGFGIAPTDFQQGDSYRIIFIHVPAAWMSMGITKFASYFSTIS